MMGMQPKIWPDWIENSIWAKSPEKGENGQPESLARHTWSVLERLHDFANLRPNLAAQLNHPGFWDVLFWATFFHDFGKVLPGFQSMLRGNGRWGFRHEIYSLAFLPWIDSHFSPVDQTWLAAAIVSHHKDEAELSIACPTLRPDEQDWLDDELNNINQETVLGLWRWTAECTPDWINQLGFSSLGVRSLNIVQAEKAVESVFQLGAKNIRSRLKLFRRMIKNQMDGVPEDFVFSLILRGHMINADHSASAHAGKYPSVLIRKEDVIEKRKLNVDKLFDHQKQSGVAVGNVLLTAPTGSGKTEAALFWAAGQASLDIHPPRLFYTLPYQASMNAMKGRLDEIFGDKLVGLQHGRSRLAIYRQLMEREYDAKTAVKEAKLARNLADLNYPPIRVFSPFQMLKAIYRLKGYEAQLSDYYQALFVFDEIHAYEVKRLAMILQTIKYLREHFSARFFVMSATLPSMIKGWLNDSLGEVTEICSGANLFRDFQRHRLEVIDGDLLEKQNLEKIANDARSGKSVLVVCNLVARSQAAFDSIQKLLEEDGIQVRLLHGRFNLRDRLKKEKEIQQFTGATSSERRPIVLVATQVVEVSLDIDLDTIYTDPAPLEALIQRFGRINRARKLKELAPVYVFTKPNDGQKIYNQDMIAGALRIVRREAGKPIDESKVEAWLDEIYSGEVLRRCREEYVYSSQDFERACIQTLRPFQSDSGLEDEFYKAFDSIEVLPASLFDEFERLQVEAPISCGELLVPISWGRYHALQNAGLILPKVKHNPPIVKTTYSTELGLTFDQQIGIEDDL